MHEMQLKYGRRIAIIVLLMFFNTAFSAVKPAPSAADQERAFEKIEEIVFTPTSAEGLKHLYTDGTNNAALFQNSLVEYRMANMSTNIDPLRRGIRIMESILSNETNVHVLTYYAIAQSSVTLLTPNFFEKLPALSRSFELMDLAVRLYPDHYLPRFYRATLKLMVPEFVGGSEKIGREDMEWVIERVPQIRRNGNYKALIHFMYAVFWGEKKHDYEKALDLLAKAGRYAESGDMKDNLKKYKTKYEEKRGKS